MGGIVCTIPPKIDPRAAPKVEIRHLLLIVRTVSAGRPFTVPYVASALPSVRLKRRSLAALSGVHVARAAFAFRNLVISFSVRSVPFTLKYVSETLRLLAKVTW